MAFLQRTFNAVRQGVLAHLRHEANVAAPISLQSWRGFADASYLDKNEVTDRVLNVVKHFEKVDSSKVRLVMNLHNRTLLLRHLRFYDR